MPTQQETFDTVVAHLRKQGAKSQMEALSRRGDKYTACMYRSPDGLKCAAGCLIPDEEYSPLMEGKPVVGGCNLPGITIQKLGYDAQLVRALQIVHDDASVDNWEDELATVAQGFKLKYTPKETVSAN